jgi:hypothetical protein
VQVLKLAAGLVKLGHLSLDGTKVQANASRHKAMSYGRTREAKKKLASRGLVCPGASKRCGGRSSTQRRAARRRDARLGGNKAARLDRVRAAKRYWRPKPSISRHEFKSRNSQTRSTAPPTRL